MLVDTHFLDSSKPLSFDVCIVGSGPAGLTIARELMNTGLRVGILESGGFDYEPEVQALNEGRVTTGNYAPLTQIRGRRYGGTATQWAVHMQNSNQGCRMVPFNEVDFEKRDWLPYSGWPFSRADLDPYYARSQTFLGLKQYSYRAEDWIDEQHTPLPLTGGRVHSAMYQFSPMELFTHEIRAEITLSKTITLVTHANVQELITDEDGACITHARIANLHGGNFEVSAQVFILAAGGVENARLLLLSDSKRPGGLGNTYDQVGRYLTDHPQSHGNLLFLTNPNVLNQLAFYDMRVVDGDHVMGRLTLTDEAMRRERLLNITTMLVPRTAGDSSPAEKSLRSVARSFVKYHRVPAHLGAHLRTLIGGVPDLAQFLYRRVRHTDHHYSIDLGGWSNEPHADEVFAAVEFVMSLEQVPHPENRIRLGHHVDALGRRQAEVTWHWRAEDEAHFTRIRKVFREDFERSKIGHIVFNERYVYNDSSHHPTGVTRMDVDPKRGVVNADSRVHDVSNLYVTGSSVFPTDSALNPTLTIIALAVRLADQVKTEMRAQTVVAPVHA